MTTKNNHIHDISGFKAAIKNSASVARDLRTEARATHGPERHELKEEAKQPAQRYRLLAYGYLRGRTVEQIESIHTKLDNLPDAGTVLLHAKRYFNLGPDGEENPADWDEFKALVEKDLKAWRTKVTVARTTRNAQRNAEVA